VGRAGSASRLQRERTANATLLLYQVSDCIVRCKLKEHRTRHARLTIRHSSASRSGRTRNPLMCFLQLSKLTTLAKTLLQSQESLPQGFEDVRNKPELISMVHRKVRPSLELNPSGDEEGRVIRRHFDALPGAVLRWRILQGAGKEVGRGYEGFRQVGPPILTHHRSRISRSLPCKKASD
jgi:hypothetical protein